MINFKKILQDVIGSEDRAAAGPPSARAYVVGDIHGRLDLLNDMLHLIECEIRQDAPERAFAVFLGDYIDRGEDSCGVINRLKQWSPNGIRPIFLAGNHEEALLRVLEGEDDILTDWLRFGGDRCAASYGLDSASLAAMRIPDACLALRAAVPATHVEFLRNLNDTFRFGDYLFVHAGIKPGIPLEQQSQSDLRWIRGPFLNSRDDHGFVVVHGHTIVDEVEQRKNRIGIDTGAYKTGRLTALVLEGERRRWFDTSGQASAAMAN